MSPGNYKFRIWVSGSDSGTYDIRTSCSSESLTKLPTTSPTKLPTLVPSVPPTDQQTTSPTKLPTISPTKLPTFVPSVSPTDQPSTPTQLSTTSPSKHPTEIPSIVPTTAQPIYYLNAIPSVRPSEIIPFSVPSTPYPVASGDWSSTIGVSIEDGGNESNMTRMIMIILSAIVLLICCVLGCIILVVSKQWKQKKQNAAGMDEMQIMMRGMAPVHGVVAIEDDVNRTRGQEIDLVIS
eukprot:271493_1